MDGGTVVVGGAVVEGLAEEVVIATEEDVEDLVEVDIVLLVVGTELVVVDTELVLVVACEVEVDVAGFEVEALDGPETGGSPPERSEQTGAEI